MKNLLLIILSFCFSVLLDAQVLKTANSTDGHLTSKTDTTKRTAPQIRNKGKADAPGINTLPKSRQLLKELENAVHGNLQMQSGFINRQSTSQELMSLTGNDKTSAQRLLMELENNLTMNSGAIVKSPSQLPSNRGNNAQTKDLLEKIRNLNQLMAMDNGGKDVHKNIPVDMNSQRMDDLKSGQDFEFERIELERQTMAEMEIYRNEIINRLIMEEYSRLNNNPSSGIPANSGPKNSKLAQYRVLRDLVREQQIRAGKTSSTTSKNTTAIPLQTEGLAKQLDQKIREEEIREEMTTRQRVQMEQKNQIQQQNK